MPDSLLVIEASFRATWSESGDPFLAQRVPDIRISTMTDEPDDFDPSTASRGIPRVIALLDAQDGELGRDEYRKITQRMRELPKLHAIAIAETAPRVGKYANLIGAPHS